MSIKEKENALVEDFELFDDWADRYEHLISLGKSLPLIDPKYKTDDYIVRGCQSKVWLNAELQQDKVVFTADSDAVITKGIVAMLVDVLSNETPDEILNAQLEFIDKVGLKEHLSPTRSNGLVSMIKEMKSYALGFKALQEKE